MEKAFGVQCTVCSISLNMCDFLHSVCFSAHGMPFARGRTHDVDARPKCDRRLVVCDLMAVWLKVKAMYKLKLRATLW